MRSCLKLLFVKNILPKSFVREKCNKIFFVFVLPCKNVHFIDLSSKKIFVFYVAMQNQNLHIRDDAFCRVRERTCFSQRSNCNFQKRFCVDMSEESSFANVTKIKKESR